MFKKFRKSLVATALFALLMAVIVFVQVIAISDDTFAMPNIAGVNEKASVVDDAYDSATSIEEECQRLTNNELDYDNLNTFNFHTIIPMSVFKRVGAYGYVGKEYGFVIDVDKGYYARIMLFDVDYYNDNSKSTINYSIIPKANFTTSYSDESEKIVAYISTDNDLYLGNLFLLAELNTVNELSETNEKYEISNDNSIYIDCIASNYSMIEKSSETVHDGMASYAFNLALAAADMILSPKFPFFTVLCSFNTTALTMNKGLEYNADSYEQQIENNELETNAAISMGPTKYLGSAMNEDYSLSFAIKYDNKMHSTEDFQAGFRVGFDIFEKIGSSFRKLNASEESLEYSTTNVYNNYKDYDNIFSVKCNTVEVIDNQVVETLYGNKFLCYGEDIKLKFIAPNNRIYNFVSSENTTLNVNAITATKGASYELVFDLKDSFFGSIEVDLSNILDVGPNLLYEGFSRFDLNCTDTEAWVLNADTQEIINNIYVTDDKGVIKNHSYDNNAISYVFQKGKSYKIYVDNDVEQNINIDFEISNKTRDSIQLEMNENYYFSYISKITNYCSLAGNNDAFEVYDASGQLVMDKFLRKDNKYFFHMKGSSTGNINYRLAFNYTNAQLDKALGLIDELNDIIKFTPNVSIVYDLGGSFDIYTESCLIAKDESTFYLEKGVDYYIFDNYNEDEFLINYEINNMDLDVGTTINANTLYAIDIPQYGLFNTVNNESLSIFRSNGEIVEYKNGYRLNEGQYYLLSSDITSITLSESIIDVKVHLHNNDETSSATVVYGHPFALEVPTRAGYTFNGWSYNGTLLTTQTGEGFDVWDSLDEITLIANWSVKDLYISLDNGGEILWVDQDGNLGTNQDNALIPSIGIMNNIIDQLLELVYGDSLAKEGHWKQIVRDADYETENSCIAKLNVIWTAEKYEMTFDGVEGSIQAEYGKPIDSSQLNRIIEFQKNNNYEFHYWSYDDFQFKFATGNDFIVPDLTEGIENVNEQGVHFNAVRTAKNVNVGFTFNVYDQNTNLVKTINKNYNLVCETEYDVADLIRNEFNLDHFNIDSENFTGSGVSIDKNKNSVTVTSTTNPKVTMNLSGNTYRVSIHGEGTECELYGDFVGNFIYGYNTASPTIKLPSVFKDRINHTGWYVNGKRYSTNETITIDKSDFGDVVLEPIFEDKIIKVKNGYRFDQGSNIANQYDYIIFDLTEATSDIIIIVQDGLEHIRLKGNGNLVEKFCFRTESEFILDMEQCNLLGREYDEKQDFSLGIVLYLYDNIVLNLIGKNIARQAEVKDVAAALVTGALYTKSITINSVDPSAKLELFGSDAKSRHDADYGNKIHDGNYGGNGWMGPILNVENYIVIKINANIIAYGGDGYDGYTYNSTAPSEEIGDKGGDGGTPGYAIYINCHVEIGAGYTVKGVPGKPGNGGTGQKGGTGRTAVWFGPSGTPGARGGDGGDGGESLYAMDIYKVSGGGKLINSNGISSYGGAGGAGGDGGKYLTGKKYPDGERGNNGKSYEAASFSSRNNKAMIRSIKQSFNFYENIEFIY